MNRHNKYRHFNSIRKDTKFIGIFKIKLSKILILVFAQSNEWGRVRTGKNYTYLATIKLLADHTWEIIDHSSEDVFKV